MAMATAKKTIKVSSRYTESKAILNKSHSYKPFIRMSGNYLEKHGFNIGDEIHVEVKNGLITIKNMNHVL
jgi:hypothetical protein